MESSCRDGRWSYSNGTMRVSSLRGHSRCTHDVQQEDYDGILFLPFLYDCLSRTLLAGMGTFDPVDFCQRAKESPGHPCVVVPPSLLRRKILVEESLYFFDDWHARGSDRWLHRPPPQRHMSVTYSKQQKTFIALLGVKISNVDKTPVDNNFFVAKILLSRH